MPDEDPDLEFSALGGQVSQGGVTVEVSIYRPVGSVDGWTLEVSHHDGATTVWERKFDTDRDAREAFGRALMAEGIRTFLET